MAHDFAFERTDVYRVSLGVARWMRAQSWPRGMGHLKDQGTRAADSMVLNTAEGLIRGGKSGLNQLSIAKGSAAEVLAVLDVAQLGGFEEQQEKLRRVGAMLQGFRRRGNL